MSDILFILPYCPFPPKHGGQIAVFNRIKAIAQTANITVLCPRPTPADLLEIQSSNELAKLAFEFFEVPHRSSLAFYRDVLLKGRSSVSYIYTDSNAEDRLARLLEKDWHVIQCEHCYTLEWAVGLGVRKKCERLVLVEQNAEHLVALDAFKYSKISLLRRIASRVESHNLKRIIRNTHGLADKVIFISDADRMSCSKIVMPKNAISCDIVMPTPSIHKTNFRSTGRIVFFATIGYFPNREGLAWFTDMVFPSVIEALPETRLLIVVSTKSESDYLASRNYGESIEVQVIPDFSLADQAVTGGDVFVSPIRLGSGIKMKNAIALGLGMPIVATPESWRGIRGADGVHVSIGRDHIEFSKLLIRMLSDEDLRRNRSRAARELFLQTYTIEAGSKRWTSALFDA